MRWTRYLSPGRTVNPERVAVSRSSIAAVASPSTTANISPLNRSKAFAEHLLTDNRTVTARVDDLVDSRGQLDHCLGSLAVNNPCDMRRRAFTTSPFPKTARSSLVVGKILETAKLMAFAFMNESVASV